MLKIIIKVHFNGFISEMSLLKIIIKVDGNTFFQKYLFM
jgi:hypothetical protein